MASGSDEELRSTTCHVLLRNWRAVGVCAAAALAGVMGCVAAALTVPTLLGLPMMAAVVGSVLAASFWKYQYLPARRTGVLVANERGIELGGRMLFSRDELSCGAVCPVYGQKPRVRLLGHRGELLGQIEVSSESEGQALLCAARLDARHAVATYRLSSYWLGKMWVIIMLGWLPVLVGIPLALGVSDVAERLGLREGSTGHAALFWVLLGSVALGGLLLWRRARLVLRIGPDGLHLRGLGRRRFVRYEQVAALRPWKGQDTPRGRAASEGFDLILHGGEAIRLRTMAQRLASGQTQIDVVAEQVREAMRAHERAQQGSSELGVLARGQRSVPEWIQHLRALGTQDRAGYRGAVVSEDALWQALRDPAADPCQRAASAVVLCAGKAEQAQQRAHQIAAATALPELRSAIEAAAHGDDGALSEALERVTAVLRA